MPQYRVTLSDGRVVTLEAAQPPSESDIRSALGEQQEPNQVTARPEDFMDAPPEGSALGRFASGVGEQLNPVTMVKGMAQAARHPMKTAGSMLSAQGAQFGKARDDFQKGRYVEMVGHAAAGVLPVMGPAAADIGDEMAATGDVARGLGRATGMVAPVALARPAARASKAVATRLAPSLRASAERRVVQALGPTKERFKAVAARRAPEIIKRGLRGSRESLQADASLKLTDVGQQIDDVLTQHGAQVVDTTPIVAALEDAKGAFQTTRTVPLAQAVREGLERSPGARVVGQSVEVPVVFEPRAIAQLTTLQQVITDLGPDARVDQLVAVRRAWDKVVADAGGYAQRAPGAIGQPLKDVSEAAAKREATKAIRRVLEADVPDLAAVNKEYAFWADLNSVVKQTLNRTQPQGSGLLSRLREGAGAAVGAVAGSTAGPFGAVVGALLAGALAKTAHAVFTSPRWRLVSAQIRSQLAEALATGDPTKVSDALGRAAAITGAGGQVVAGATVAERPADRGPGRAQR